MNDIVDTIARVALEFRRQDMAIDAIVLKDHEQGMRLLHQLHQVHHLIIPINSERGGKVIEHPDGSVWMQVEVYGVKLRWPASKYAKREGGYVWT